MKEIILSMTTDEFVEWMNFEFLDPHSHGYLSRIFRMNDDYYWTSYLKGIGSNIALSIANGIEQGCFRKTDTFVQYRIDDNTMVSFNDKEDFFERVWPLSEIVEEIIESQKREKEEFRARVLSKLRHAEEDKGDERNVLDLRLYIDGNYADVYSVSEIDELYDIVKDEPEWFIDIYENIYGENRAEFSGFAIFS